MTDVPEFWAKTEERLLDELASGRNLRTPVSLIYHSLEDVNDKLRLGRYFFIDILSDGMLLIEDPGHPFAEPRPLSPAEALRESRDYFEEWFESADQFFRQFRHAINDHAPKVAAFQLHKRLRGTITACSWFGRCTPPYAVCGISELCRAADMPIGREISQFSEVLAVTGSA